MWIGATTVSPVGRTASASTPRTVRIAVAILCSVVMSTAAAMATGAYWNGISLDDSAVGKSSGIHAIIGGKVSTDVEGDQGSPFFGR